MAPKRIFITDAPRTCSQLFTKLFLAHPQLGHLIHPLILAMYGPERVALGLKHSEEAAKADKALAARAGTFETYADAVQRMEKDILDIEAQGKIPWIKEHGLLTIQRSICIATAQSSTTPDLTPSQLANPTHFSDSLLSTFTSIILIRNPILMVRSCYRVQGGTFNLQPTDEDFKWMTTLQFSKFIFDAMNQRGKVPIVIDAEDVVYRTEAMAKALCKRLDINESGVQYHWDALPRDHWPDDPIMQGFFVDMLESEGVRRGKQAAEVALDLDQEVQKWKTEYGEEPADRLKQRVEEEMPVYKYLRGFKMNLD